MKRFVILFVIVFVCFNSAACNSETSENNAVKLEQHVEFCDVSINIPGSLVFDKERSDEDQFYYDEVESGEVKNRFHITVLTYDGDITNTYLENALSDVLSGMGAEATSEYFKYHKSGFHGAYVDFQLSTFTGRLYLMNADTPDIYLIAFLGDDNMIDIASESIKTLEVNGNMNNSDAGKTDNSQATDSEDESSSGNLSNSSSSTDSSKSTASSGSVNSSSGDKKNPTNTSSSSANSSESSDNSSPLSSEKKNALEAAKRYLSVMAFSRNGLIKQLEYEGFSNADATYGVDSTNTDWNEQAIKKAKDYLQTMPFSKAGLKKQLEFDGFTNSQAQHGANNCMANWNEQAAKKARNYLEIMSFSKQGLIDQLIFDGFTQSQAEYGVSQVYLPE